MRVNKKQEVCFAEMPERPVQRKAIFSLRHAASALGLPGPQANSVTGPPRQGSLRTKAQHRGKRVGLVGDRILQPCKISPQTQHLRVKRGH